MDLQAEEKQFLQALTLRGLTPLAGERTRQSFYYVLKGRKSNQTYQDTHIYSLFPYYRLFPSISREQWEEILFDLQTNQFILPNEGAGERAQQSFVITQRGSQLAEEWEKKYEFARWFEPFTSISLPADIELFWMRLHLLVQTVSHLLVNQLDFFPVVSSKQVQNWVKQELHQKEQRARWMNGLGQELYRVLQGYPVALQRLVMDQLSGASQVGHTLHQIALREQEPPLFTRIKFRYMLASLYQSLRNREVSDTPLLKRLCIPSEQNHLPISVSAYQTYQWLKREKDIETIAKSRGLRRGTIEDHLVEIALHCPDWDHSHYLSVQAKEEIIQACLQLGTKRLRVLREFLQDKYTYLQLRLALAQMKENVC